nr:MAG TPA: hypothetical protein [Caudoviricetes sp.]
MTEAFIFIACGAIGALPVALAGVWLARRRDDADRRRLLEAITRLSHTKAPPELFAELSRRITCLERRCEGLSRALREQRRMRGPKS